MRVLLLLRGSAGCGKSTYIKENGLKPYTLCADDIRLMCSSPIMSVNGEEQINQSNDKVVWNTLFRLLETRMQNGEFTVIDAINSKTAEMNKYKELAKNYRYRIYCVDMTDIPIEETKRRNAQRERESLKRVPDEVIEKFYSRFETQQIPSGIKVLKPDELDTIWYKSLDLSNYKKVHILGDIHGCYSVLKEYIDTYGGIKSDEAYIFLGDYIDRGIENAEVINWMIEQVNYPNMIFLEGNHERWLWMWANDLISRSKEFEFKTKPQLVKAGVSKKRVREFYRRLCQCAYFAYNGKTFVVTHGGISNMPDNFTVIATEQMIKGVGKYSDADDVDKSFTELSDENVYQIHGHRNITGTHIQVTDRTFNLQGDIEYGGNLRAIQITKDGITPVEIKNNVFVDPKEQAEETTINENVDMSVYELVENMRKSRYVYEKSFGRVSSFNFTRQAFERNVWNNIVTRARGLYIDTVDYKIVARSYDKFFNVNERPETMLSNLQYKLQFPVTAYVKENGFLGIVGWDSENDDLLITSKSSPTGDFSGYLKDNLYTIYGEEKINKMKEYIIKHNVSFVFECCDMINDPHIIEYPESKVVLLDVIKNQMKFDKLPYDKLVNLANEIGFVVKKKAFVIDNWGDFFEWYNEVTAEGYTYEGNEIEGFVIEDSIGYMTKMKLHYYKFWKKLRGVASSVFKYGNYKWTGSLLTPLENDFFGWCKTLYSTLDKDELEALKENSYTNICSLRNMFFEWKEKHNKECDKNV